MQTTPPGQPGRDGFTLFEMICVLALIVVIAAISIPVISTTLTDARTVASADIVRARLADTRARALDDGQPWRLACIPNTGIYQLAPENSPAWNTTLTEPDEQAELIRDELPPGIVFALDSSAIFPNDQAGPSGGNWETLAVYLANGTARDDMTFYFGKPGIAPFHAQVRAITGTIVIMDGTNPTEAKP